MRKNRRYKKIVLLSFILVLVFHFGCLCVAAEEGNSRESILGNSAEWSEMEKIEGQLRKYGGQDIEEIIPQYDPQKILTDLTKGEFEFNLSSILGNAARYIFKEIYLNIHILIKLIVLIVLCAILKNLQTSFLSESVGELAFYVCYIVIVSILVVSFNTALTLGRDIIDNMVTFMHVTIPVLIALLISGGNITSGGVFQPILIAVVEISATIIKNGFIPLIFFSTILSILDNLSDKIQVSKLAAFFKQVSGWCLGVILTVFIAVLTIQGSLGAAADGITSKTAKFAIGAFIPVAGKYLADAADTVIGCTLIIKNAAGVAAMIGIIAICVVPILKIAALIALYKITGALVEPIAEKRISKCISDVTGSITFILAVVASVAFMFLISITAIIGASNISTAIR